MTCAVFFHVVRLAQSVAILLLKIGKRCWHPNNACFTLDRLPLFFSLNRQITYSPSTRSAKAGFLQTASKVHPCTPSVYSCRSFNPSSKRCLYAGENRLKRKATADALRLPWLDWCFIGPIKNYLNVFRKACGDVQ